MESGCSQTKYSHISKLLSIWFASLCLLLIVANVRSAAHWISDSLSLQGILFAAAVVCAFALLVWFLLKLNTKSDEIADENHPKSRFSVLFAAALFLLSFSLKAIFVFIIKTPQYSDFQLFYWVTVEIAEGIPNYLSQRYFEIWAYQTGFPAANAQFVNIHGRNINSLVLVNFAFASLNNASCLYDRQTQVQREASAYSVNCIYDVPICVRPFFSLHQPAFSNLSIVSWHIYFPKVPEIQNTCSFDLRATNCLG